MNRIRNCRGECRVERTDSPVYNLPVAGFEIRVTLKDEEATAGLGARIAQALAPGDVIALSGELGAGKTALARSILRARGVEGHVPSPTFTLLQAYETPGLTIHHLDLYRIENPRELMELGLEDALEEGALLIEWPERGMPAHLAADALEIALEARGESARIARISGPGRWRDAFSEDPA
jgi:tRNA threonylcarbamoyladenosine biosynthesis protein TsaE